VRGSCNHGNKASGPIKAAKFVNLTDCWIFRTLKNVISYWRSLDFFYSGPHWFT
jgi:hypothetical protein